MPQPFILDGWLVEPDLNTMSRDGTRVRLEPKVMELCVALARTGGAVVSKAALLETVWPEAVVGEDALTRAISELRKAFDDDARQPRVIETIPKRGYRLLIQVRAFDAIQTPDAAAKPGRWMRAIPTPLSVGVGLFVVATMLWPVWPDRREADRARTDLPRSVLVADVEHPPEVPAALAETLWHSIARQIGARQALSLLSTQEVEAILRRMRRSPTGLVTQELALELSARHGRVAAIVVPRLDRAGGEFLLTIQSMAAANGQVLETAVTRGRDDRSLLAALERDSNGWLDHLTRLEPVTDKALPAVTTKSLSALRYFTQAVDLLRTVPMAPQAAPWPDAAEFLRKALAEDEQFVLARVWLAQAIKSSEDARLSYLNGVRETPDLHRKLASECLAETQALGEAERLFVEGMAYGLLEERQKAIAALEALLWADREFFELETRAMLFRFYSFETRSADADQQILRIADLAPEDFDATVLAAQALVLQDGDTRRAAPRMARARALMAKADVNRENSAWLVAWLELSPAYEAWKRGDLVEALSVQRAVAASLSSRTFVERDAVATRTGHMWLTLGRIEDARRAFDAIGQFNQKEYSLSVLADIVGNRRQQAWHLSRHGDWSWNPLPFARAGLFDRMRASLREPAIGADHVALHTVSLGEEALANGRLTEAINLFQQGLDRLRIRPEYPFYWTSISLARAWQAVGDHAQVTRVLEEAVRAQAYPGTAAPWIKAQVYLSRVYRLAGRHEEADALSQRVRRLLSYADVEHPFLRLLEAPAESANAVF